MKEEKKRNRVFICSPLQGYFTQNLANAKKYARHAALKGNAVFVPHLLYTQFLDDSIEEERRIGIDSGKEFLRCCDELWAFAKDYEHCSPGMKLEIDEARTLSNIECIKFIDPDAVQVL